MPTTEEQREAAISDMLKALEGLVSQRHAHEIGCGCPWCFARSAMAAARAAGIKSEK